MACKFAFMYPLVINLFYPRDNHCLLFDSFCVENLAWQPSDWVPKTMTRQKCELHRICSQGQITPELDVNGSAQSCPLPLLLGTASLCKETPQSHKDEGMVTSCVHKMRKALLLQWWAGKHFTSSPEKKKKSWFVAFFPPWHTLTWADIMLPLWWN